MFCLMAVGQVLLPLTIAVAIIWHNFPCHNSLCIQFQDELTNDCIEKIRVNSLEAFKQFKGKRLDATGIGVYLTFLSLMFFCKKWGTLNVTRVR